MLVCVFKDLGDCGSCKSDYMWNPSMCGCECNKACKNDKNLDIKNCSYEKGLLDKLTVTCQDEILNTRETSNNDNENSNDDDNNNNNNNNNNNSHNNSCFIGPLALAGRVL